MMRIRQRTIVIILLILGLSSASDAEYLIYLKGGHFIVADDCTFSTSQGVGKGAEVREQSLGVDELTTRLVEDCTNGRPEGHISWSTINGNSGEVNTDDVYAIFGTKSLLPIKPSSATMPLEDYLITNRGGSFANAKVVEQKEDRIYGVKRDDFANINRRGITGIEPEGKGPAARAEGLCPGEPAAFSVTDMRLPSGVFFNAEVTNLLPKEWTPQFHLWVREKTAGKWLDKRKFLVEEIDALAPGDYVSVSKYLLEQPGAEELVGYLKRALDPIAPDPTLQVCARKVKESRK